MGDLLLARREGAVARLDLPGVDQALAVEAEASAFGAFGFIAFQTLKQEITPAEDRGVMTWTAEIETQ